MYVWNPESQQQQLKKSYIFFVLIKDSAISMPYTGLCISPMYNSKGIKHRRAHFWWTNLFGNKFRQLAHVKDWWLLTFCTQLQKWL